MRLFYLTYPIRDAVSHELTWTHYRLLLKIERSEARAFYEKESIAARWSTRELNRQIASLLFERLALSKDKAGLLALAKKGHDVQSPTDLVKDPYVLEFTAYRIAPSYSNQRWNKRSSPDYKNSCLSLARGSRSSLDSNA